jgi:hypothetical protein
MRKLVLATALFVLPVFGFAGDDEDMGDQFVKAMNLTVQEVWNGSEEITAEEKAELDSAEAAVTTRGIAGFVIVYNTKKYPLHIARGRLGKNYLGMIPPYVAMALYVGDFSGDTKLWASSVWSGTPKGTIFRRTVTGTHATYRWNL